MESALECALAWLEPRDVAAAALTSATMASAAARLTSIRSGDVARGMEPATVPVINSQGYPYFEYSASCVSGRQGARVFKWGSANAAAPIESLDFLELGGEASCTCEACGSTEAVDSEFVKVDSNVESIDTEYDGEISCKRRRVGASCPCGNYGSSGEGPNKDLSPMEEGLSSIYECGASCSCSLASCIYRTSQRGLSVRVKVVKSRHKGWGLYAAQWITRGTFICVYAGELLTTEEARRRQKKYDLARISHGQVSSLLVLREHLPSGTACLRVNIDATNVGNVARFINHSCDGGNLSPCLVRSAGSCFPRLAFFASRDIAENEELTFSYGSIDEDAEAQEKQASRPCFCGTQSCRGILPSEKT